MTRPRGSMSHHKPTNRDRLREQAETSISVGHGCQGKGAVRAYCVSVSLLLTVVCRTIIVRLISTAQTGYFYTAQRLRIGPRLAAVKYDPRGASGHLCSCLSTPLTVHIHSEEPSSVCGEQEDIEEVAHPRLAQHLRSFMSCTILSGSLPALIQSHYTPEPPLP